MIGRTAAVALAGVLVWVCTAGTAFLSAQSSPPGAGTPEQIRRGERIYRRSCAKCHLSDLSGSDPATAGDGEVPPPLAGPEFLERWSGSSVGQLFLTIKRSMPQDAPGTLAAGPTADVVAYILSANGVPNGPTELPADAVPLEQMVFPPVR